MSDRPYRLFMGDCLDVMKRIPDGSVDMIAADLPYGTTACKWDTVIPFAPLWMHYKRIIKSSGAIVLTASQPFTSVLVMSNPKWFRYTWVWDKVNRITGFLDAKKRPLRRLEDVCIFYRESPTYNPQMVNGKPYDSSSGKSTTKNYGKFQRVRTICNGQRYPQDLLQIKADNRGKEGRIHSTQKPIALFEYLIRTYTNAGETVLDNTMGSGTTIIAALNTGRKAIGIEKDAKIFETAFDRILSWKGPSCSPENDSPAPNPPTAPATASA